MLVGGVNPGGVVVLVMGEEVARKPWKVALMVVWPVPTAVIKPLLLTVRMVGSPLVQTAKEPGKLAVI